MQTISIYIHVPFCIRRCLYCDFNTFAGMEKLIPEYIQALAKEIGKYSIETDGMPVATIYLGGGTPSLIPLADLTALINLLQASYSLQPHAEITLEANPGTVDTEYLKGVKTAGVNRLSLGIQSLNDKELKMLGRIHSADEAKSITRFARIAGFDNINLDLIYGLPTQSVSDFLSTLHQAIDLQPEHFSLYALTLDEHVPLAEMIRSGKLPAIDNDLAADMYELATDELDKAGYHQYEISNWARRSDKQDVRSRHNLQYWHNLPYLGLGAGAHGSYDHYRVENVRGIKEFINLIENEKKDRYPHFPEIETMNQIGLWEEVQETMMLGLRLTDEGVGVEDFYNRYKRNFENIFEEQIKKLVQEGLVEWVNPGGLRLRLTRRGRLLGNRVFREFVGLPKPTWFDA